MNNIIGLIPLSGNATRMKNLPKFLLPCKPGLTLLDNTILTFKNINVFDIYAGVSDSNYNLLTQYDIDKKIINSLTMSETVKKLIESYYAKKYILIMPDTFFHIDERFNKIEKMLDDYNIVICVWKIKDYQVGKLGQVKLVNNEVVDIIDKDNTCKYEYAWGVIAWRSVLLRGRGPEQSGEKNKKAGWSNSRWNFGRRNPARSCWRARWPGRCWPGLLWRRRRALCVNR